MIVNARSRSEAIAASGVFIGQLINGMQVVKIEARIILPDVYEVDFTLGPINELCRLIEKASFVFYA